MFLIIGCLCILFWMLPPSVLIASSLVVASMCNPIVGGKKTSTGLLKLGDPYFVKPIKVSPYASKWANGNLVAEYPQCLYVTSKMEIHPQNLKMDLELNSIHRRKLHFGQRKLLLSEIDFLSCDIKPGTTVVYAGAADGRHIPILTELYPALMFHLYDPRPFHPGVKNNPRIKVNPFYEDKPHSEQHGWFTDEVAESYDGQDVWFVSDIRTEPTEEEIEKNQAAQKSWILKMHPERSMLKLKIPYPQIGRPTAYNYLGGVIHLQCWAPITSAETRLIVPKKTTTVDWDILKYERQCAWYNNIMRLRNFNKTRLTEFGIPIEKTLDEFWLPWVPTDVIKGFDFVYEIQILQKYIEMPGALITDYTRLIEKINSVILGKNETLAGRLHDQKSREIYNH